INSSSSPIFSIQIRFGNFSSNDTTYKLPINDEGESTLVPFITPVNLVITSTNNNDDGKEFYIEGLNLNGEKVNEILECKGQTKSNISTNVYLFVSKF